MPTLATTNFNIVLSVLGGWISVFGLVSYLLKERFYLSEARKCRTRAPVVIYPCLLALDWRLGSALTNHPPPSHLPSGWSRLLAAERKLHQAAGVCRLT